MCIAKDINNQNTTGNQKISKICQVLRTAVDCFLTEPCCSSTLATHCTGPGHSIGYNYTLTRKQESYF